MKEPSAGLLRAIAVAAVAAVAAGIVVGVVVLTSDTRRRRPRSRSSARRSAGGFIATGLWAWRREPEPGNRTGKLLVALGFAWLLSTLEAANAALPYTMGLMHDGAQSRLVALALLLRSARTRAGDDPGLGELLDRGQEELQTSLAELREPARGIHPAVLTDRGLEPALETLTARAPVPVTLEVEGEERLPEPVESVAYFVVSEAFANVAKYARATRATVAVRRANGSVTVEVTDDGVGGADAAGGSGLRGLADRLAALDGTLRLDSPAGRGTRLHAEIPV